ARPAGFTASKLAVKAYRHVFTWRPDVLASTTWRGASRVGAGAGADGGDARVALRPGASARGVPPAAARRAGGDRRRAQLRLVHRRPAGGPHRLRALRRTRPPLRQPPGHP